MKFRFYHFAIATAMIFLASCNKNTTVEKASFPVYNEPDAPVWTMSSDSMELGTKDFYTFDIERDYTQLDERLWTDPAKKQYVENSEFADSIHISYNGDKAIVNTNNSDSTTVTTNGAHVTITATGNVECTLTGKTENGSLKIDGKGKVRINLHGVDLRNANGPAIDNQSQKMCFLVTDSVSTLSNDSILANVDTTLQSKGCIYSKGELAISGKAPLKINSNFSNAIHSGKTVFIRRCSNIDIESHDGSAIKAKNNVKVEGGVLNINSTGRGGSGIAAKKTVEILGGRTTIISNTGNNKDGKNSRGIKSDSIVAITGGIVRVKESSVGGKGIRAGHSFLAKNCIVDVLTFGEDDGVTGSKNRGIFGVNEVKLDGARVRIRTQNGWNEGLSSRRNIIINNSLLELDTRDDAISAGDPKLADIEVNNSRIFANAGMDGIDSNGTIHINSGLIFSIAGSQGSRGFDCDAAEFKVGADATIVGIGQKTSYPTGSLLEHPACFINVAQRNQTFCLSTSGENDNLISFTNPSHHGSSTSYGVLISLPQFKRNVSYDFCYSANVNPQHTFHGLMIGGTVSGKSGIEKRVFNSNFEKDETITPATTLGATGTTTRTPQATALRPRPTNTSNSAIRRTQNPTKSTVRQEQAPAKPAIKQKSDSTNTIAQ